MRTLFFYFAFFVTADAFASSTLDTAVVNKVIRSTLKELNSIHHVKYDYYIELNYLSENYHKDASKKVYMEFDNNEPLLGLVFTDSEKTYSSVFNGEEYFNINKKANTIELTKKPSHDTFRSQTFFVNSYYSLKRFLPIVLSSDSINRVVADTIINGKKFSAFRFTLNNYMMGRFGKLEKLSVEKKLTYTVIIDDKYLPLQVIQRDNLNPKDYTLVKFSAISINGKKPSAEEWKYETYVKMYKPVSK
ncbi:hypothetical protein DYU11_23500 [Fibrisoma montanum]|uniref:Outer membrane lipoprotein-sorting protein n=1 Tax=Fibrisoma montanum TaxID=2305895 RepID=A0A418M2Y3_9BACT|nr:hypothetical protein [Fibrisoma montanum]RIV19889.1 hypothetical protein DYU11_23500 [Fibrisoma montanum]